MAPVQKLAAAKEDAPQAQPWATRLTPQAAAAKPAAMVKAAVSRETRQAVTAVKASAGNRDRSGKNDQAADRHAGDSLAGGNNSLTTAALKDGHKKLTSSMNTNSQPLTAGSITGLFADHSRVATIVSLVILVGLAIGGAVTFVRDRARHPFGHA